MDRQVTRADLERLLSDQDAEPVALPLSLLGEITDSFSTGRIIGTGGFAVVYKGILANGVVAVKMLSNAYMNPMGFHREVESMIKAKHKNVVRFLGYCGDTQQKADNYNGNFVMADVEQKLLCFEYLPNGTLRDYIKDASCGFEWRQRLQIIREICEGLQYLHQKNIIHCDLKPENILLNHNMVPQIIDFGVSRCFGENQSRVIATTIGGTLGYMPPEYLNKEITYQFDLYSLGVIMMEIVTGKRDYDAVEKVLESWRNRTEIPQSGIMLEQIRTCVGIWTQCIDNNRANRPTIQYIIDKLSEMGSTYSSIPTGTSSSSAAVAQIILMEKGFAKIVSVDVHSTKPWIVITHFEGPFRILNYQKEEFVKPNDLTREQEGMTFLTAKFIERKEWIVAGGCDGYIYVFDYNTMKKVYSFEALTEQITCLAIHRTKDYVLASSYDFEIGLWDWENGWHSVQKFEDAHDGSVPQVAFDPKDDNAFASVSKDGTIKIWHIGFSGNKTLTWHSSKASSTSHSSKELADSTTVRCLDYFARENNQYLIIGSDDGTVKIWDVQKTDPIETLSGHKKRVSAVCSHPQLPLLMTGSRDGTVCVWNSNTFRLERTLTYGLGEVHALGCIRGSRRVVIGHSKGLAIVEVDKDM